MSHIYICMPDGVKLRTRCTRGSFENASCYITIIQRYDITFAGPSPFKRVPVRGTIISRDNLVAHFHRDARPTQCQVEGCARRNR